METWLFKDIWIVDPSTGREARGDFCLHGGAVVPPSSVRVPDERVVSGDGLVLVPAFIDLHVHLREPGNEAAETVLSGARAAARGGFGTVLAMPNTQPPCDTPEEVRVLQRRADAAGLIRVLPSACVTRGRAGRELADLPALAAAGAAAYTDDGAVVADAHLLRRAMALARQAGRPILEHALDPLLAGDGVVHAGDRAALAGLPGIPSAAETAIVARDIGLAAETGCALHIQHVSARESIPLLREAAVRGLSVSAEATPHHLALSDADVDPDDARYKMNPPLRSPADRAALVQAVADGTIRVLATDHAPHTAADKARGFLRAPFGVVGLETAVGVTYTVLVASGRMSLLEWVRRWTTGPAAVLGLPPPALGEGAPATCAVLDLRTPWRVRSADFVSHSRNTPFEGMRAQGRALWTFCAGRRVWGPAARAARP